ncbi:MAG TPA: GH92 family glycosyl hydrolase [archaeon]|nr:GH92 family glycosyl hydrolase [archaeon]
MRTIYALPVLSLIFLLPSCEKTGPSREPETKAQTVETLAVDYADYVDPLIGTTAMFTYPGNTFPAVCPPFGMTQWSAETARTGELPYYYSPYSYYEDPVIEGFVGSHFPSGSCMSDYGSVSVMAISGSLKVSPGERGSHFRHSAEIARPYYYAVNLDDSGIRAEMTASGRCGFFRFNFTGPGDSYVIIDAKTRGSLVKNRPQDTRAAGWVKIDPAGQEISGFNAFRFTGFFTARFDRPFLSFGTWSGELVRQGNIEEKGGNGVGAFVRFDPGGTVKVKVGTSFISTDQARKNLELEIPDWDFDAAALATKESWNRALGKIRINGESESRRTIFYTALYHSLLLPRIFSEHGLYRSAFDNRVHQGTSYNDFSLWDTFRAEHPLLVLLEPARTGEMVSALLAMYEQGGWMPKWPNPFYTSVMSGTHADAVVADAWLKGVRNFDPELAYRAMYKDAMTPGDSVYEARGGLELYKRYGYLPADSIWEGTSRNLEFSYDDFCLAQIAGALGKEEDRRFFLGRSQNYKNSYDRESGFMRGKNADGSWIEPFRTTEDGDRYYTEGTAWQYTWFVPHDVRGLIDLMGREERFTAKLDSFFTNALPRNLAQWNPYYHHGNEPAHHAAYLFAYAGQPWKTHAWVRKILSPDYLYSAKPGGLPENDDCGQMSAWYVFSALGFYPVCPGEPVYVLGSPVFPEAALHLDNGSVFRTEARNVSEQNIYIQAAELDSEPYEKCWISHSRLLSGGTLTFTMGPEPNRAWASAQDSRSLSASQPPGP